MRSAWRRLISAGLPAPSQTTTSKRSRRSASASRDDRPQLVLQRLVGARVGVGVRPAHDDDLAVALAGRLDEDRVHRRLGLDPGRRGLHRLRAADLAAVGGDDGVQRHVLRLERRDADALAVQPAADAGGDDRLAGVGVRAADEQRAVHRRPCPTASARRAHGAPRAPTRAATGAPRARDVGRLRRRRRPSPSAGRSSTTAAVGERAAEAHAERAGERGLHAAGVRARVRGAVARAATRQRARGEPPTTGAQSAVSAAPARAAGQLSASSSRAAAQPKAA